MIENLLNAIALVLVIEGIYPFICPDCFRRMLKIVEQLDDRTLRILSLISMALGVVLLYVIHQVIDF